jgi:hypothetical protein
VGRDTTDRDPAVGHIKGMLTQRFDADAPEAFQIVNEGLAKR